jgi:predicted NBD/HSP70 family sugar kinase
MRSVNGIQLLHLIRQSGPISRAGLAKLSKLSKPTVSEQINRLLALDVVVEIGPGNAAVTGGKRPTMVAFHANAGRVAGIGIGSEETQIALADLQGEIKARIRISTSPEQGARKLLGRIERSLASLRARDGGVLRTIAIGVPGRVDCTTGTVLESGSVFDWKTINLQTPFEERFGCPVLVDNDVNVALVAELRHGAARGARSAVLIQVDTGIGSAMAIHGRIHHGSHWAAGEIGHLAVDRPVSKHISPRGQLESVVGADQIRKRVRKAARESSLLSRLLREQPEATALFSAARQKDRVAARIVADVVHHLSVAVAQQALAYDPDIVLLSGESFLNALPDIRKFLSRTIPWSPKVEPAAFGEEAVLIGSIDMALTSAYEQMSRRLQSS